jgi:type IV pilus assembly protein PilC
MAIIFNYRGFTATGEKAAGATRAPTIEAAREDLRRRGVMATTLRPAGTWDALLNGEISLPGKKRTAQILFFRTFAMLARAGKDTDAALSITIARSTNKIFRESLEAVRAEMLAGATLSDAVATRPDSFSPLQVAMLRVGEKAGAIDDILERLAGFIESERATGRRITGAVAYPVVVLSSALSLLVFMFTTIIPGFASFFVSFHVDPPATTRLLLQISTVVTTPFTWFVVGVLLAGLGVLLIRLWSTRQGRVVLDRVRLNLPIFGPLVAKSIIARTARLLALLLQSGVDIDGALEILIPVTGSVVYEVGLEKIRKGMAGGESFVAAMESTGLFDGMFVALLESGEETGAVDRMLVTVSKYYEDEIEASITVLNAALQPILLLFLGGITGLIAVGVYLPLYQFLSNIH